MVAEHARYAVLDLVELEPFAGNARRRDLKPLINSVNVNGQYRSLIIREQEPPAPKYTILAGHGTADALKAAGHPKARCEILVCTDEEALKINMADNRTAEIAFWDDDALAEQLELAQEFDFSGTGWDAKSAAKYLKDDVDEQDEAGAERWAVVIECEGETQQTELLARFLDEGLSAKALIT